MFIRKEIDRTCSLASPKKLDTIHHCILREFLVFRTQEPVYVNLYPGTLTQAPVP